jgi:crossover junction endodeoxyribonuclease RusA
MTRISERQARKLGIVETGVGTGRVVRGREYRFTVPGRPVPAARMTKRGKFIKPQAQRYLAYKHEVGWRAKEAGVQLLEGIVAMDIAVYVCGHSGDWDNYAKAICDALNGIAYADDNQVKHGRVDVIEVPTVSGQRAEVRIRQVGS